MRRRILLLVVGMTVLVVLAFSIPLAILIRSSVAQDARNKALAEAGRITLYVQGYPAPSATSIKARVARETRSSGLPISVTLPTGTHLGSTPADRFGPPDFGGQVGSQFPTTGTDASGGDGTRVGGGGTGRTSGAARSPQAQLQDVPGGQLAIARAFSAGGPTTIRVYLSDRALHQGEVARWSLLAAAAIVLVLVGVGAGEILTRRTVRPLLDTARTATQLASGDTTARAPTDGPREIADVGLALNRLADRIDELIAEERETVADLSHRLRTPLTALRLDAEALDDESDAERIGGHVSALERMLTAVIRAASRSPASARATS